MTPAMEENAPPRASARALLIAGALAGAFTTYCMFTALEQTGALSGWAIATTAVWFIGFSGAWALMPRSDAGAARLGDHALSSTFAFSVVIAVASLVGAFLLRDSAVLGTAMTEMTAVARGSAAAVLAGAGEELFFRNGVRRALPGRAFVPVSAAAYTAVAGVTGNVALALMAAVLGTVCATALQLTGRWWSPRCIHFTWTLVKIGLYPALTPNL